MTRMKKYLSSTAGRAALIAVGMIMLSVSPASAASRWMLIYYRQIGNVENANKRTIENHVFREDGTKGVNIGVTNLYWSGTNIFGNTNEHGYRRIDPLDPNNCTYDIRLYDPSTPTQQSPTFFWRRPNSYPEFYSYITHWMYVTDDSRITTHPTTPVYHYDLVSGINQATNVNPSTCVAQSFTEPSGANSDAKALAGSATYQAQTFVVPPGINRIVSAQAFLIRGGGAHFTYRATIRQGSPTGAQVGGVATSRDVVSVEFVEAAVNWPLNGPNAVVVTPGQTYALRCEATDGQGFNVYGTTANNYPNGSLWHGQSNGTFTQNPNVDMIAFVVGAGYDVAPATLQRSPASFSRSVVRGNQLASDSFTIANSGGGTLGYTIGDNAPWLSVSPTSGDVGTETDTITVNYDTAALPIANYNATITISAPGATNTPQTIGVSLQVQKPPYAPVDNDQDNDVDMSDFGWFQRCYTGNGNAQTNPACAGARLDPDEDVDVNDFTIFFDRCFAGANVPVDSLCAE